MPMAEGAALREELRFATGACGPSIVWNCCREQSRVVRETTKQAVREFVSQDVDTLG